MYNGYELKQITELTQVIGGAIPLRKIFNICAYGIVGIVIGSLLVEEILEHTVYKRRREKLHKECDDLLDYYLGSPGYYVLPKGTIPILLPATEQEYILIRGE